MTSHDYEISLKRKHSSNYDDIKQSRQAAALAGNLALLVTVNGLSAFTMPLFLLDVKSGEMRDVILKSPNRGSDTTELA
jgi:hypothetical protein